MQLYRVTNLENNEKSAAHDGRPYVLASKGKEGDSLVMPEGAANAFRMYYPDPKGLEIKLENEIADQPLENLRIATVECVEELSWGIAGKPVTFPKGKSSQDMMEVEYMQTIFPGKITIIEVADATSGVVLSKLFDKEKPQEITPGEGEVHDIKDLFRRYAMKGAKIEYLPEFCEKYNLTGDSLMAKKDFWQKLEGFLASKEE